MKLKKLSYKYICFFSLIFLFALILSTSVYAKVMTPTTTLEGTVRVNICGDYIAENPEECDREDFKSLSCTDFGYSFGNLRCNSACEINSKNCYNATPVQEEEREKLRVVTETKESIVDLPTAIQFLILFDEDGDGIISASEIPAVIVNWINLWKAGGKEGDLNGDGESNIYDFSTLMYNITYSD